MLLLAAIKTRSYVSDMPGGFSLNVSFVARCVTDLAAYTHSIAHKRVVDAGGVLHLSRQDIRAMCYHAFLKALEGKRRGEDEEEDEGEGHETVAFEEVLKGMLDEELRLGGEGGVVLRREKLEGISAEAPALFQLETFVY
jgi:hypothetical protein